LSRVLQSDTVLGAEVLLVEVLALGIIGENIL
jgi:hypothetical protein